MQNTETGNGHDWWVGQLADLTCVTMRTLRHYDQTGLLHPFGQTADGHRLYDQANVVRLCSEATLAGGDPPSPVALTPILASVRAATPALAAFSSTRSLLSSLTSQPNRDSTQDNRLAWHRGYGEVGGLVDMLAPMDVDATVVGLLGSRAVS